MTKRIAGLAGLVWLLALSLPAHALDLANIQVSGSGTVEALPDYINIHISVEKINDTKSESKRQVDVITQEVLDVASSMEIEADHVHASQLYIYPEYQWKNQSRQHIGERALRTIQIKLYKLDDYSELAEKLVKVDITQMQQQGFGFDNIDTFRNKAIQQALDKAQTKAELIAGQIGRGLGKVYQVSESSNYPVPVHRQNGVVLMAESDSNVAPAPLEIKPQSVTANVNVIYLIE